MMNQYREIKAKLSDAMLFFRLGDFYEMFESDAIEASKILDLTLTARNGVPMCGIPYHAAQSYIGRLLKAKKKIAICEQTHIPKPGKGIATREIVEIITPGTVVDENLLEKNENNYLVSIGRAGEQVSFSYIDLSTSDFAACSFPCDEKEERIRRELARIPARELIIQESLVSDDDAIAKIIADKEGMAVTRYPDWYFSLPSGRERLCSQLGVTSLRAFGLEDDSPEIVSCGTIIEYLSETSKSLLPHIKSLRLYTEKSFLSLDEATQKNLELIRNTQDGSKRYTLLEVLDHTKTSMGARRLRKMILSPLVAIDEINARLASVEALYKNQLILSGARERLAKILDIERLCSRVALDKAHAKDLLALKNSLSGSVSVCELLIQLEVLEREVAPVMSNIEAINPIVTLLSDSIMEDPSILLTEGNIIRRGYNSELDGLHDLKTNARAVLDEYLQKERKASGISSLKLRYNRIIGHYFEVTKTNLHLVPSHFIRRQSIVSGERFSTNELIEKETEIASASARIADLERELFIEVRGRVKERVGTFLEVADAIAGIDSLQSFATASTVYGYTRPSVDTKARIEITDGRHPVVEANIRSGQFVPNSITLDERSGTFVLLTGPNMAGKSTFLRQVALITLMAQIGCFVPAMDAKIGIVDKIFLRVGASDNLARGESTFLVEMSETAHILRNATERSLLILDEVGRGTSTKDGLAIAQAVSEYILGKIRAKTIFATHFRELTTLDFKQLVNLSLDVLEKQGEIVFLKRVKKGASDNSYGIHVAKLAGIPEEVTLRAEQVLASLEKAAARAPSTEPDNNENELNAEPVKEEVGQRLIFSAQEMILQEIENFEVQTSTPIKALNAISRWKDELRSEG